MIDPAIEEAEIFVARGTLDGTISQGPIPAFNLKFKDIGDCYRGRSTMGGEYIDKSQWTDLRGHFQVYSVECDGGGGHMISARLKHSG